MNLKVGVVIIFSASLVSCAHQLSYSELKTKIETTDRPSIYYKGSDSEAHHFDFIPRAGVLISVPNPRAKPIEVSTSTAVVNDSFPLTDDESKWRGYALFLSTPEDLYLDPLSGRRFYEDVRPASHHPINQRAQQDKALKP